MIVSSRPKTTRTFQYAALVGYMLFLAFPLLWLLSVSFKGPRELVELHPHLIPTEWTLANYHDALHGDIGIGDVTLLHAAWNSTKVAGLTAILTTLVGLPAAYVLARTSGFISKLGLGWIPVSYTHLTLPTICSV